MADDFVRLELIFGEAAAKPVADRSSYLDTACGGDEELRRRVEALLASLDSAGGFLDLPDSEPAAAPDPAGEGPGSVIGRYKLLEKIGEGGFGVVFMAEQQEPIRRNVAFKIIKLGMDTRQVVARFEAERQALALMDHPNIAMVLDAGSTELSGRPYFVMELVRGIPITTYCNDNKLSTEERLNLFMSVCGAVQHAHQKGIIHRDLKPSNVLVTMQDAKAAPKIIDFGIAKAIHGRLTEKTIFTEFRQMIGTPAYMSPEQAQLSGLDVDTRSDIYSLGVMLYELLTGSPPFDSERLLNEAYDEMRRIIREVEPPRPSTRMETMIEETRCVLADLRRCEARHLSRMLRGDLDWIVMKCLEKDRARRYESASGLADDVRRFLFDEPVEASPPSAVYRLGKFYRKHRRPLQVAAAAATLFMALFVTSTVVFWVLRNDAARERDAAIESAAKTETARRNETIAKNDALKQTGSAERALAAAQTETYFASIYAADAALQSGNVVTVASFLETAPPRLRNWEWGYLHAMANPQVLTLHPNTKVTAASYSSDGSRIIAIGHTDRMIHIWETATGRELSVIVPHSAVGVPSAANSDGTQFAATADDNTVRLWDRTGMETAVLRGHTAGVSQVAFSRDGTRLATASNDKTARIWDTSTGREIAVLRGHTDRGLSAEFSPDGARVVTASADATAKIWDAATGKELITLRGSKNLLYCAAFSPDGTRVAAGGQNLRAYVWNAATGVQTAEITGNESMVATVSFSPDGRRLAASTLNVVRVFDAGTGAILTTLRGHNDGVWSAIFNQDGTRVLSASLDKTVRVWDAANAGGPIAIPVEAPLNFSASPAFNLRGTQIVGISPDHVARIWSAADGKPVAVLDATGPAAACAAFCPDGTRVVTGCADGTARVFDASGGRLLYSLTGDEAPVAAVVFSPDGKEIVAGTAAGAARVWNTAGGTLTATWDLQGSPVLGLTYNPGGTRLAIRCGDNAIHLWDPIAGKEIAVLRHDKTINMAAFSPDGHRLLTTSQDYSCRMWDADTGKQLRIFVANEGAARYASFSPDGLRVVTATSDLAGRVWDAATGKTLVVLVGHEAELASAEFSPDGTRILTCSRDSTARLWDAATGRQVMVLRGHTATLRHAAFSRDGTSILTVSADGTARVWDSLSREQRAAAANQGVNGR